MLWCCVALLECNAELKEFSELLKTVVHCEEELLQCIDSIALYLFVNVRLQMWLWCISTGSVQGLECNVVQWSAVQGIVKV